MKILLRVAAVAGVLAFAAGAWAADFAGTWKGAFDFQGNSVALTFYLATESGAVTGTVEGLPTSPAEIHDGKIDGDMVTFSVNTDYQGQSYKLVFKGTKSSGDASIHFTLGTEDGSWSSALVAERAGASGDSAASEPTISAAPAGAGSADSTSSSTSATASVVPAAASSDGSASSSSATAGTADVTGTWKGSFDYQGTTVPVTFHLTAKDGALTGTVEGMMEGAADKPVEIQQGTVDGGAVSFTVNTQYQGETFRIVYKGKLDGGTKIDFTFGTDDGSWSNEMTVTRATESAQQ
jgi:hypothetical protein